MSRAVIEAVREKILSKIPRDSSLGIVWHAGEPTAAPIDWYEWAYARLEPVRPIKSNFAMQTNGLAIDRRWIELFRRTNTAVSLSIDGPEKFHDSRRITRNGKPTWTLALRGLRRLQDAGFTVPIITVLHPACLPHADEFFSFYQENGIVDVSFSIDEMEGFNKACSFGRQEHKAQLVNFLVTILKLAYQSAYPLRIREIERIAGILAGFPSDGNEQIEPWASLVIAANGNVSTYSPEFMEVQAPQRNNFVFGNILVDDLEAMATTESFRQASSEIAVGVQLCSSSCRYFGVCGGGSPVNKYCELKSLSGTETQFCRLTTQASADALIQFLSGRSSVL